MSARPPRGSFSRRARPGAGGSLAALSCALVAAACGSPPTPAADAAVDAPACIDDCAPYACSARTGACGWYCLDATGCAPGHACVDRACVGTACTPASAAAVCGPYACVNGSCAHDCAVAPCNPGYYCRGDTLTCAAHCTEREDRRCAGYLCDVEVGECEPYCFPGELDCAAGFHCAAGNVCLPDPA